MFVLGWGLGRRSERRRGAEEGRISKLGPVVHERGVRSRKLVEEGKQS